MEFATQIESLRKTDPPTKSIEIYDPFNTKQTSKNQLLVPSFHPPRKGSQLTNNNMTEDQLAIEKTP